MTSPPPACPPDPLWRQDNLVNPHHVDDKARRVASMFEAIAPSYDLNNRVHSLGRDQAWRRAAVRMAGLQPEDRVLDVACGTGDLTMAFADAGARQVVGADFTAAMLDIARSKRGERSIDYQQADAMALAYEDASFDVLSIAFGLRNVSDPARAMAEFHRVLRPGGRLIVLEFGFPRQRLLAAAYRFYFNHVLPRTASWIARDRSGAYRYLPRSVETFLTREQVEALMDSAGFNTITSRALTFGVALLYRGIKQP